MAKTGDLYTQRLYQSVNILAAGGTLGVHAFTDAYKPEDLIGFVLQEVRYYVEGTVFAALNTALDRVKFGLPFLQTFPAGGPEVNNPGILDHHAVTRVDVAAPAADVVYFERNPIAVRVFSDLKGDGLLVHPVNLFLFGYADAAIAGDVNVHAEISYYRVTLTDALHKELWQSIYIRQV